MKRAPYMVRIYDLRCGTVGFYRLAPTAITASTRSTVETAASRSGGSRNPDGRTAKSSMSPPVARRVQRHQSSGKLQRRCIRGETRKLDRTRSTAQGCLRAFSGGKARAVRRRMRPRASRCKRSRARKARAAWRYESDGGWLIDDDAEKTVWRVPSLRPARGEPAVTVGRRPA